jgi:hypothetical protein
MYNSVWPLTLSESHPGGDAHCFEGLERVNAPLL